MLSDELLEAGGCQRVLIGELLAPKNPERDDEGTHECYLDKAMENVT